MMKEIKEFAEIIKEAYKDKGDVDCVLSDHGRPKRIIIVLKNGDSLYINFFLKSQVETGKVQLI